MECLNIDYRADPDLFTALDSIRLFMSEASTCKSIDCYLMKLGTLINSVEETFGNKAEEVFRKILLCNEVRDSLRPLVEHIEVVESLALTDPRHRPVKRYMNLLIATLGTLQSTSKILEITRPPTYKIEQEEREIKSQLVQFEKRYNTTPVELTSKPSIEPTEEYTSPSAFRTESSRLGARISPSNSLFRVLDYGYSRICTSLIFCGSTYSIFPSCFYYCSNIRIGFNQDGGVAWPCNLHYWINSGTCCSSRLEERESH